MPQSMLGILALLIFSLFAVHHQRKMAISQQVMVRNAVSVMLNGVAAERLEEISSMGYDQAVVDNEILDSASDLSSPEAFGPSKDHTSEDDLDDFHAATDTLSRRVDSEALQFVVYSEVAYASEANPEVPATGGLRTKYKLITVSARSLALPDLPEVTLTRSVSCGSGCAW